MAYFKTAKRMYHDINNFFWNTSIEAEIFIKNQKEDKYIQKINILHNRLHIPGNFQNNGLMIKRYPSDLVLVNHKYNEVFWMTEKTRNAWYKMEKAAKKDGIVITIRWAFRSIEEQAYLLRKQIAWGGTINKLLTWIAAPGYSEHHTGCLASTILSGTH